MKLGFGGRKQNPVEKAQQKRSYVVRYPFTGTPAPAGGKLLDRYPLINPYAYAAIIEDEYGGRKYYLDEVPLAPPEANVYSYILDKLETELTIPRTEVDPKRYFGEQAKRIVAKYGIRVAPIPWAKIIYFAERDLVGFGVLDALLKDPNIEDISIDGIGKPIFVYHRKFESLGSNVMFAKDQELDNLITRLAHMAGKHISTAFPILQGTLPGRHRLMATFRREISPYGSTMTIRKFREDPLTIVDLLNSRVIDHKMAAYFWLLMENKATTLVVGSSVDYATPMLYRVGRETRLVEAGKLIDPYFAKGEEGRKYTSGVEVYSFNPSTLKTGWHPVQYVYRHRHAGKLLRFKLQTGREVNVTRDHSLFVLRRSEVVCVPASDIGLGDYVVAAKSVEAQRSVRSIDLVELLASGGEGLFFYGVPKDVFKGVKDIPADTRKDWKHCRRLPLKYFGLLADNYSGATLGYKGTTARISPILKLDEDLARVLGYYIAEGHIIIRPREQYCVEFTLGPGDATMEEEIRSYVERKFGTKTTARKHTANSRRLSVSNHFFAELLLQLAGTGARKKHLPEILFDAPSKVRRAFLEAWSRGDAGVTGSCQLMNGVLYLLLMERSIGSFWYQKAKGTVEIEGRSVAARDSYHLRFPRPEDISSGKWRAKRKIRDPTYPVSLLHDQLAHMSYKGRSIVGNPSAGQRVTNRSVRLFRERIRELLEYSGTPLKNEEESTHDGFYRSNSKYYDKTEGVLRPNRALLELQEKFQETNRLVRSNLAFLKVIGLEEVDSTSQFVYDVSVPGDESFLAGTGGVFCHNTGSGKTTLLNALLTLTRTNSKIVTIEEVQEVNIPHFNWTALLSRENYGATGEVSSQVNLFDLVKAAMRMRPDIIVVGEVRGEEAYVLFQAISTGHGGSCTIHADDVESAVQRLTSKPMDVPASFIPFLDLTFTVRRISVPTPGGGFRAVRRIVSVDEVTRVGEYFNVFRWNAATDTHKSAELRGSPKLNRLAKDLGIQLADITEELNKRSVVLRWLQERGIRNFREVSTILEDYSSKPEAVFEKAVKELGIQGSPEAMAVEGFKL